MKKFYILIIVLLTFTSAKAQTCLPQGITFTTQSQIDNFHINYPNCTQIQGSVTINGSISNLNGLNVLTYIGGGTAGGLTIYNTLLANLTGLDNLTSIGGDLVIDDNQMLSNLTGLENLTSIGGMLNIYMHGLLTSLYGLENLSTIGGHLTIESNESLGNVGSLSKLTSIGGWGITIDQNPWLYSLVGLDNITSGTINNLDIHANIQLSTCDVKSICTYLVSPSGSVSIYYNANGCNSKAEVQTACATIGVESLLSGSSLTIYPVPSSTQIIVEALAMPTKSQLSIINLNGQQILQKEITETTTIIDISTLPSGVYAVKVVGEKGVQMGKIVKQ